jgi:hypothetical protein
MGERAVEQERDKAANGNGAHESGRYQIEPETQVTSKPDPQPLAAGASNSAILAVHRLSDEELGWIEERTSRAPRPANTQHPVATPADPEEIPTLGAMRPYYREPTLERVQLQFEDKSLDPSHNPLALSSLRPPAKRQGPSTHMILSGVGALALVGVGYLAALAGGGGRTAQTSFAPASEQERAPRVELVNPPRMELAPGAAAVDEPVEQSVLWSAVDAPSADEKVAAPAPAAADAPVALHHPRVARARSPQRTDNVPSGLPAQPSRDEIKLTIEASRAALQTCAGANHGMTTAHITILGSGRVSAANIEGAFAGTLQGSCMARALRAATFPRFSAPSLQVTYPFRL